MDEQYVVTRWCNVCKKHFPIDLRNPEEHTCKAQEAPDLKKRFDDFDLKK
ncbi:hypothetical protein [Bacillus phage YungSlug]|nr:hypothetical protein [Bacillus phage YungSlug]